MKVLLPYKSLVNLAIKVRVRALLDNFSIFGWFVSLCWSVFSSCSSCFPRTSSENLHTEAVNPLPENKRLHKTNAEWRKLLTPERFEILRNKGTEKPHSRLFAA